MKLNSSCVLIKATFRHLSRGKYALKSVIRTCTVQENCKLWVLHIYEKRSGLHGGHLSHPNESWQNKHSRQKCRLFEQGTRTRHPPSALKDIFFLPQAPRQNATWIRGQSSQQVYIESSAKYTLTLVTDVSCSFRRQYIYIYFKSRELTKKH